MLKRGKKERKKREREKGEKREKTGDISHYNLRTPIRGLDFTAVEGALRIPATDFEILDVGCDIVGALDNVVAVGFFIRIIPVPLIKPVWDSKFSFPSPLGGRCRLSGSWLSS